ncbi:cytochrome P450 family protein [Planococcus lenghuensis]|uniref:Cytochrome P450 n=1 Tax=Planococcus lenghuensis TaxID=2213202 RepID=A0A1Q2KW12_9BACL|nr:cytochrome P450 [Planococcus lenghuensis]AQQ51997.1 cytochrome P450 [Planococcus lenghuensis]
MNRPDAHSLLSENFTRNPYPVYTKLRETAAIARMRFPDGQQGWLVTRYADAVDVLTDRRFIKDYAKLIGSSMEQMPVFTQNMLFADPPDHRRLRNLAQKAFTPKMISSMRERIQEIADELLDQAGRTSEMNLIDDYAFPLPIIVICEILGIPAEDRDRFRRWSNSLIEGSSSEAGASIYQHMQEFIQYLSGRFALARQHPDSGLISQLIAVEEAGDRLTEKELYGLVTLLIIAGHETTVNLIGNCVLALLSHPEQKRLLQNNPELIGQTIEEALRFNGPVEFSTSRWAGEDVEFRGRKIRKGELVIVSLNSADHDPEKFNTPELFDITRDKSPHLAFGKGIHQCLGAPLARLEGEIAISSFMKRFPEAELKVNEEELEWRPGMIVRGVRELPLLL